MLTPFLEGKDAAQSPGASSRSGHGMVWRVLLEHPAWQKGAHLQSTPWAQVSPHLLCPLSVCLATPWAVAFHQGGCNQTQACSTTKRKLKPDEQRQQLEGGGRLKHKQSLWWFSVRTARPSGLAERHWIENPLHPPAARPEFYKGAAFMKQQLPAELTLKQLLHFPIVSQIKHRNAAPREGRSDRGSML